MSHFRAVVCLAAVLSTAEAYGEARNPDLGSLIDRLQKENRPEQAMAWMRSIYASDNGFTFPDFENTSNLLKIAMEQSGLHEVQVVPAPADGVTQVGFWTMPMAWDAKSARLEIISPTVSPGQRLLADYKNIPASLGMWSGSTPPEGVEAEVVAVSKADIENSSAIVVRGKLALMDVNPAGYKWWLVKNGAIGAINTFTENPGLEHGRQWINAWGDSGWAFTKRSTPLLSFSISPVQAKFVRQLLDRGKVRVRAMADTRYYSGSYPYVTGIIRGTGPEEVLVLAHTSEQGAQDNATGVAASLEALRSINGLIEHGVLPRPKRSIRALLMPEMYGSMHYVEQNPERIRRTVAAICVDTPAGSYDHAGTEYSFHLNPDIASDFTDAMILKIAETYFPRVNRPWHEKEFATGTDTYLSEPMVGIPTIWPYSGSGVETHHNSEDTPDDVDARSMRDLSTVTAAYLYYIANAGESEAVQLAELSEARGYRKILRRTESILDRIRQTSDEEERVRLLDRAVEELRYAADRERQAVSSVQRLAGPDISAQLQPMLSRLDGFATLQRDRVRAASPIAPVLDRREGTASGIIVKRKRFGTIPLDDLPREQWEGQPSGAWALRPTIALYWCDGKRDLAEVIRLTELELGSARFDYVAYFRFLHEHGYVDLIETPSR